MIYKFVLLGNREEIKVSNNLEFYLLKSSIKSRLFLKIDCYFLDVIALAGS